MKNIPTLYLVASCVPLFAGFAVSAAEENSTAQYHYVASSKPVSNASAVSTARGTYLGVSVAPVESALGAQLRLPKGQGLLVMHVASGSPAEAAGIRLHDILLKLDDQILIDPHQLSVLVGGYQVNDRVSVLVVREGEQQVVAATLKVGDVSAAMPQWRGNMTAPLAPVPYRRWGFAGWPYFDWHSTRPLDDGPQSSASYHVNRAVDVLQNVPVSPDGAPMILGPPGEGHVMFFRPQADIVFVDEAGSITIRIDRGVRTMVAKDIDGAEIYRGPIGTPEERAGLSEDLRNRLEKLESITLIDAEAVPETFEYRLPPPMPPPPMSEGQGTD